MKVKEEEETVHNAMRQYFKRCTDNHIKVQPFFISFEDHTLFLSAERINLI
jgi:hypothetical protein